MIKKLALYPATKNNCTVARFSSLLDGYVFEAIFVPQFYKLEGVDIAQVDGGEPTNITVVSYSQELLTKCDVLYIDYDENIEDLRLYQEVISHAEKAGMEIVLSLYLSKELNSQSLDIQYLQIEEKKLYTIPVPVIAVLSQGLHTNQFATELSLRQYFLNNGYRVEQIGSCEASLLFGFTTAPDFLYSYGDAFNKIVAYNHYLHRMIEKSKPELLIMGVSSPIMRFNNKVLYDMGIQSYIMCTAARPDASIVNIYHGVYPEEFFDSLSLYCQHHLSCSSKFYNIANCQVEADGPEKDEVSYVTLESKYVKQSIQKMAPKKYNLFNALDKESVSQACVAIEDALSGNVHSLK
jgi:peptide maturation system protein (TIGR04066 family)